MNRDLMDYIQEFCNTALEVDLEIFRVRAMLGEALNEVIKRVGFACYVSDYHKDVRLSLINLSLLLCEPDAAVDEIEEQLDDILQKVDNWKESERFENK